MSDPTSRRIVSLAIKFGLVVALIGALIWALTPRDSDFSTTQARIASASEPDRDPDRSLAGSNPISDNEYLRLRGEYVAERRGLPYNLPYDPRSLAIQQLNRQEALRRTVAGSQWTPIGPAPIPNGQTTGRSDPVSGRVTAIAIHPTNPDIAYVGTAQGGVYRTLDGGTTWTPLMDSAQSLAIGAVAIAPSNPDIVYVGTGEPGQSCDSYVGVGLYRIDNASTTADLTGPIDPNVATGIAGTTAFKAVAVSKILVSPLDPATIFVSTMSGAAGVGCTYPPFSSVPEQSLLGLYRSTNATAAVASIAFSKLTVTSAGSVAPDTSGNRDISDLVFEPGNPDVLLAWVIGSTAPNDGGVWRTTNALAPTPSFSQPQATSLGFARGELAINKIDTTVNVVAATEEGTAGVVRKSADGGVTWPTMLTSLGAAGSGFCDGQCWYDIAVALDPTNANLIYLGGAANDTNSSVLAVSANGTTFSRSDTGLHADTHALAVAPSNPAIVYVGNDGGIWKSTDYGVTWTSLNNGQFSATQFESVAVHPADPSFLIGGTQDNGTEWRRPDGTWFRADFGDGGYSLIDQNAVNTTTVTMYHTYFNLAGGLMGFARVTSPACAYDSGSVSEWVFRGTGFSNSSAGCEGVARAANNGIGSADSAVLFFAPMALGPGNPNSVYFGTDRLYRSADRGDTMTAVSQRFAFGVPVTAIGISPQDDNVRIVGTRSGQVYRTMTGANPLADVTPPSLPANPGSATRRFISRVAIDPNDVNTAYVALAYYAPTGQAIWKTSNLNADTPTWTSAANGIPSIPIGGFVVDPADGNTLYAGTDIGVYRSTDGGANWSPFSQGLPRVAVFDMALQNANRILRVATHGRGIYEISVPTKKHVYLPLVLRQVKP